MLFGFAAFTCADAASGSDSAPVQAAVVYPPYPAPCQPLHTHCRPPCFLGLFSDAQIPVDVLALTPCSAHTCVFALHHSPELCMSRHAKVPRAPRHLAAGPCKEPFLASITLCFLLQCVLIRSRKRPTQLGTCLRPGPTLTWPAHQKRKLMLWCMAIVCFAACSCLRHGALACLKGELISAAAAE